MRLGVLMCSFELLFGGLSSVFHPPHLNFVFMRDSELFGSPVINVTFMSRTIASRTYYFILFPYRGQNGIFYFPHKGFPGQIHVSGWRTNMSGNIHDIEYHE